MQACIETGGTITLFAFQSDVSDEQIDELGAVFLGW